MTALRVAKTGIVLNLNEERTAQQIAQDEELRQRASATRPGRLTAWAPPVTSCARTGRSRCDRLHRLSARRYFSGAIIASTALALVLWRSTRVVNFAQLGQAMFTTYIALTVRELTGSWFLGLIIAMAAGLVVGVIVHFLVIRPVKRLDTSGAIIATFGVLIALEALAAMVWGGVLRPSRPPLTTPVTKPSDVSGCSRYDLFMLALSWSWFLLECVFTRTNVGLAMRASAFNPEALGCPAFA